MEMLDAYSSPHGPLVLSEAIQEIFEGIHEICGSMNLRLPQLILAGDKSACFGKHMASSLNSILIHLLRNSVDHGLRHELEPKIMIDWAIGEQGHLALEYADSGRGLHLARLAEVGTRLGITGPSSTEEDLAALIFRSGLSTKSSVTELSGRGIGMDAVRAMCRELGGDILLHFTGPSDPDGYRRFAFTLQMGPANIELEHKTMTTAEIGLRLTG
jgi:two-component system chemotaxis sensor kinase CheA